MDCDAVGMHAVKMPRYVSGTALAAGACLIMTPPVASAIPLTFSI